MVLRNTNVEALLFLFTILCNLIRMIIDAFVSKIFDVMPCF